MDTPPKVPAWVVVWQSRSMAAPAFWYYHTEEEAQTVAATMPPPGYRTLIRQGQVPADFDRWAR